MLGGDGEQTSRPWARSKTTVAGRGETGEEEKDGEKKGEDEWEERKDKDEEEEDGGGKKKEDEWEEQERGGER